MEAHAAFIGADGVVVLRTVAREGFDRVVVEFDGKIDFQHAGRTLQDFINGRIGFQPVTGGFHLFARDFKRIEGFFCKGFRHFASFSQREVRNGTSHQVRNYNQFSSKM